MFEFFCQFKLSLNQTKNPSLKEKDFVARSGLEPETSGL